MKEFGGGKEDGDGNGITINSDDGVGNYIIKEEISSSSITATDNNVREEGGKSLSEIIGVRISVKEVHIYIYMTFNVITLFTTSLFSFLKYIFTGTYIIKRFLFLNTLGEEVIPIKTCYYNRFILYCLTNILFPF